MSISVDLTGRKFGRLTVIEHQGLGRWLCECECKNTTIARTGNLNRGFTKSCGCLKEETGRQKIVKHGLIGTSEYEAWSNMKYRCLNPKSKDYPRYGGRGIKVCERWIHSFENFISDMGLKPTSEHSIERKNNDGDYTPDNCCWGTRSQQNKNKRRTPNLKRKKRKLT